MSRENVELMRRVFELLVARDIDSLAALGHEDWEHRPTIAGTATGAVYRGIPGLRAYFADLSEAWERHDQVAEEFIDLKENGVLVISRLTARGRTSGVELAQRIAVHVRFKDGQLWRSVGYTDVDQARRAVGLA